MPSNDPAPSPASRPGLIRRTFRRHWPGLLATWLLGTFAAGFLAYSYVKPSYRALSLIRVDPSVMGLFSGKPEAESIDPYLKTQVQLITSQNVLTAAGANPKVAVMERFRKSADVVQDLRKSVNVSVIPGTYLIEVSVTSANAYESATIVNAVVDSFIEANSEWSDGMTRVQIKNLEQYNLDLKNQTDELERKWMSLAAKGDLDPPAGDRDAKPDDNRISSITIEQYKRLKDDLHRIGIELADAQALLTAAKAAANRVGPNVAAGDQDAQINAQIERRLKTDPDIAAIAERVMQARNKLTELLRVVDAAGDPAVRLAKQKLASLEAQYKQLYESKSQALREEIELGKGFNPDREIREATTVVNKLMARQVSLRDQFTKLDVKNRTQATDAVQVALLQDERKTLKSMQEAVVRRLEQLRYEAKGEARIRPVNPNGAMVPGKPISDHRPLILSIIPFVTLALTLSFFVGVEAWSRPKTGAAVAKVEPEGEV